METLRLEVYGERLGTAASQEALVRAAEFLRAGGLVALPTETVYGLGANALDPAAVARIFAAKERPNWDPLIVHIADRAQLDGLVSSVPSAAERLIERFWPGPLTLLLPRSPVVPDIVTAGRELVGVRMPSHPVALALLRQAGVPVAAPSANRFGHISPTTAAHVLEDLDGRIEAVVDAGPTEHGLESTVLDPTVNPMQIYRPGAVTLEQIRAVGGAVELFRPAGELLERPPEALPSPGVGLRHYAPRARLLLVELPADETAAREAATAAQSVSNAARVPQKKLEKLLQTMATECAGERLGVLLPAEFVAPPEAAVVAPWGSWRAPAELAHSLYGALRDLDQAGCTTILCPLPPGDGLGAALHDRLRKAASKRR